MADKTKKEFFLPVVVLILIFYSFSEPNETTEKINNSGNLYPNTPLFLVGAAGDYKDIYFNYVDSPLGFTLWHNYVPNTFINKRHYPDGWTFVTQNDKLFSSINEYQSDISSCLQNIGSHNMKAWMQRPKIEYLVYGQRSDYRCVDTTYVDKDLWFYTFQSPNHVGLDIPEAPPYGNGNYVRYCQSKKMIGKTFVNSLPGIVVSRLRTNAEQSHRGTGYDGYRWDTEHEWYIKPRIRVDSSFAMNNPDSSICRLTVLGQDGVRILKDINLKGRNFLNEFGRYDGKYLEEFRNLSPGDSLIIKGDWGDKWLFSSRGNKPVDTDNNMSDIQLYWYGNCDMWVDYIRVDNDVAHNLLDTNTSNPVHQQYMDWIKWEAQNIACNNSIASYKFYLELMEFNQIPCVSFINRKLDSLCDKKIDMVVASVFYQYHMSWEDRGKILKADQIKRQFIDRAGITKVLQGHLPFTSIEDVSLTYSMIPNTLPVSTGDRILARSVPPDTYEAWLQANLDTISDVDEGTGNSLRKISSDNLLSEGPCPQMPQFEGKFRFELELANEISKLTDVDFVSWVQVTQWFTRCSEIEREPTSEELDLISNMPIAYGASGLFFYEYGGWESGDDYNYAFTEPDGVTPRLMNVYGQQKWNKLISIIKRVKKWSEHTLQFDNREKFTYINRIPKYRNLMKANSYVNALRTGRPDFNQKDNNRNIYLESVNNRQLVYDSDNETHLQFSTFKTNGTGSLYFMLVNKRCSPYVNDTSEASYGGKRQVEMLFKNTHTDLSSSRFWLIRNVDNPEESIRFDKDVSTYVNLGKFNPGEGKLYSLTPDDNQVPIYFALSQNYPNPFNSATIIKYSLPSDQYVRIRLYDILGREVQTLVNGYKSKGFYEVSFNSGSIASGIYFYKMVAGNFQDARKMIIVK
jgi:hypothetical protein